LQEVAGKDDAETGFGIDQNVVLKRALVMWFLADVTCAFTLQME
jgi:hypothetical protein